ncbi:MAG: hypothetical protein E7532_02105 [Ruminococcaceae bacterium]|nr:hypothetical protein [Oscillospiraceae bacterium]
MKNKSNPTDIKLNNIIKISNKLYQGAIIVTVLTAILCVIKIIFTIGFGYIYEPEYLMHILILEAVASVLVLAVEIFVCILASNLSSLADLFLKNNITTDSSKNSEATSAQWQCPSCKKINQGYIGTCGCGEVKPN